MTLQRWVFAQAVGVLVFVILAGLVRRRYVACCWSFFLYLAAIWVSDRLMGAWMGRVDDFALYSAKETVLDVMKYIVALEVWLRTFVSFPRARLRVGLLLTAVLIGTAMATLTVEADLPSYYALASLISPRQKAGSLTLFAVIAAGAWWYRIPLHSLHRAILLGFAGYLTLSTFLHSLVGILAAEGWSIEVLAAIDVSGYFLTCIVWARAAWRRPREPSQLLAKLQPWAQSA